MKEIKDIEALYRKKGKEIIRKF